ncbi:MAG: acyl-CoA thioesterase [Caulobacteraceae bacterium]
MINQTKIRTRYSETDQMGIIYHSNYFVYFEVGRTNYLEQLGMTYKEMEQMGIIMPVTEVNCKYIKSALYYDELTINTYIKEMGIARMKFGYQVYRGDELLAEGFSEHAFVGRDNHRPLNLKKHNRELYDKMCEIAEQGRA